MALAALTAGLCVQVGSALCRGHLTEPVDLRGVVTGLPEGSTDPRLQQVLDLLRLRVAVVTLRLLRGLQLVRALQDLLTEDRRRHHWLRGLGGGRLVLRRVRLQALQHDQRLHALELLVLPLDVLEERHVALRHVIASCFSQSGTLVRTVGTQPALAAWAVDLVARLIWWLLRGGVAVLRQFLPLGGAGDLRVREHDSCTEAIL